MFTHIVIGKHVKTTDNFDIIRTILWCDRRVCQYAFARVGVLSPLQRCAKKGVQLSS